MTDNNSSHDVFISYSRKNRDAVLPIKDEIERTLGLKCWIDLSDIPCGSESFKKKVIPGIRQTRVAFLFFLSAESQASEYAMKEVNFAKKRAGKPIVLVRFNDDELTDEFFFDYQDADIIDWRVPEQKGKLLRDLRLWSGNGEPPPGSRSGTAPSSIICRTITLPGGAKMEMIYCPPGEFMMGSPMTERDREDDEALHRVRLTKGFWLGKYPVTQGQWQSVMGNNPSEFTGDDALPVESVSWNDCQEFIAKVNASQGCGARLPTEAEWEYSCRAGTTTAYFWGDALNGDRANCDGNYPCGTKTKGPYFGGTTPVWWYPPNPWGFYDMHGNVFEWCNDWDGVYPTSSVADPSGPAVGECRVLRGGGWDYGARVCRSAHRYRKPPGIHRCCCGFRLCCSAGPRVGGTDQ